MFSHKCHIRGKKELYGWIKERKRNETGLSPGFCFKKCQLKSSTSMGDPPLNLVPWKVGEKARKAI